VVLITPISAASEPRENVGTDKIIVPKKTNHGGMVRFKRSTSEADHQLGEKVNSTAISGDRITENLDDCFQHRAGDLKGIVGEETQKRQIGLLFERACALVKIDISS
jgi:hypothetical protein